MRRLHRAALLALVATACQAPPPPLAPPAEISIELLPGLQQEGRSQQAADDVGAGHEHAPTLEPRGYDSRFAPRRGSRA